MQIVADLYVQIARIPGGEQTWKMLCCQCVTADNVDWVNSERQWLAGRTV